MSAPDGLHVGIIMDGNGRWAARQGKGRYAGHRVGARAVRACVRAAPDCGVRVLTLYAFSTDNWKRPEREVRLLLRLFERHLHSEIDECVANGVRIQVIGRRDRLGDNLRTAIDAAEGATRGGERLLLRLAIDYSARDAILAAAERVGELPASGEERREAFGQLVSNQPCECLPGLPGLPAGDVDLIIRTGGECRLSDFLLWEGAYAELYFTEVMWPDFGSSELHAAIAEFRSRERRFGSVPAEVAAHATPAREAAFVATVDSGLIPVAAASAAVGI
ncbi:MAG: polyprenyl diphosphate synthase [Spirochaetaceae bacterium]|nr:polyprenyl diphosphate synthase [Spirochaetaceae bacterium]